MYLVPNGAFESRFEIIITVTNMTSNNYSYNYTKSN